MFIRQTLTKQSNISKKRNTEQRRRAERTPEQDEVFFRCVSQGFSLSRSAEKAGYTARGVFNWRVRDQAFAAQCDECYEIGTEIMIDEARRRGMAGINKPVFHKGEVCGHIREYSDTLLIFLLKARKPDVFRENYTINGEVNHRHTHEVTLRAANDRAKAMVAKARGIAPSTIDGEATPA